MSVAYFDCFSGASGDMILGAFVDVGLPLSHLKRELKRLKIGGYEIVATPKRMNGIKGADVRVLVEREPGINDYKGIKTLIERSSLPQEAKEISLEVFSNLARAEASVHGRKIQDIHFHEIGGLDSIVDIVGAAIGVEYFGFKNIYSSPLPVTRG